VIVFRVLLMEYRALLMEFRTLSIWYIGLFCVHRQHSHWGCNIMLFEGLFWSYSGFFWWNIGLFWSDVYVVLLCVYRQRDDASFVALRHYPPMSCIYIYFFCTSLFVYIGLFYYVSFGIHMSFLQDTATMSLFWRSKRFSSHFVHVSLFCTSLFIYIGLFYCVSFIYAFVGDSESRPISRMGFLNHERWVFLNRSN